MKVSSLFLAVVTQAMKVGQRLMKHAQILMNVLQRRVALVGNAQRRL